MKFIFSEEQISILRNLIGRKVDYVVYDVCFFTFVLENSSISFVAIDLASPNDSGFELYGVELRTKGFIPNYTGPGEKISYYSIVAENSEIQNIGLIDYKLTDYWTETGDKFEAYFVGGIILQLNNQYFLAYTEPYSFGFCDHEYRSLMPREKAIELACEGGEYYTAEIRWLL